MGFYKNINNIASAFEELMNERSSEGSLSLPNKWIVRKLDFIEDSYSVNMCTRSGLSITSNILLTASIMYEIMNDLQEHPKTYIDVFTTDFGKSRKLVLRSYSTWNVLKEYELPYH